MAEITNSKSIIEKIKEFDKCVEQSLETLKTLRKIRNDAEKLTKDLSRSKNELDRHEKALLDSLQKAQNVSGKITQILSPILKEKEELERLDRQLSTGITEAENRLQRKVEKGLTENLELVQTGLDQIKDEKRKFVSKIEKKTEETRKELDGKIVEFLYKQNALVSNLTQQIDSYQRLTDSQSQKVTRLETENINLKSRLETNESHIQRLEKESAEFNGRLNEIVEKMSGIRFKGILGLK